MFSYLYEWMMKLSFYMVMVTMVMHVVPNSDYKRYIRFFTGLALAYRAAGAGGSLPTVYNAANEKAVALFLERKISYLEIPELIGEAMEQHKVIEAPTVEQILEAEAETYEYILGRMKL